MTLKIIFLIPLAPLLFFGISCQEKIDSPDNLKQFCLESKSYPGRYYIKVSVPEKFDPDKTYTTLYVLDAEDNFNFVSHHCKRFSEKYAKENVMVVGIAHGRDRTLDYTPTAAAEGEGGAAEFLDFIKNELLPYMEKNFDADTSRSGRIILGHSFGGLLAAYAISADNEVFGNYIMLSPSLWYDNEYILRLEEDNRNSTYNKEQLVFLGIGQLENSGRMQAPFHAYHQRLEKYYPATRLSMNIEAHLNHVGSKNPNIIKGLEFYFQHKTN